MRLVLFWMVLNNRRFQPPVFMLRTSFRAVVQNFQLCIHDLAHETGQVIATMPGGQSQDTSVEFKPHGAGDCHLPCVRNNRSDYIGIGPIARQF